MLADRDFNDDTKDAGEIGAGHVVTALYELVPPGGSPRPGVDPLRYQAPAAQPVRTATAHADELMAVKLRYKDPEGAISKLIEFHVPNKETAFEAASQDFKFAAGVAAFGMLLRKSPLAGAITYADVLRMAEDGMGHDSGGYRSEFIDLVRKAREIAGR